MAVRVRKLAKELRRTPWEVLGMLHALGFVRYRSPNDMLPDNTAGRVRKAWREGTVRPLPLQGETLPEQPAETRQSPGPSAGGWMDQMVSGVVPADRDEDQVLADVPDVSIEEWLEGPSPEPEARPPAQDDERRRKAAEALYSRASETLSAEREALAAERSRLEVERAALERDRQEFAAAQQEPAARPSEPAPPVGKALVELLEERGLRGADEQERALGGLANARLLREVVGHLVVDDADVVRALLDERLTLVGGQVSDLLPRSVVGVTVSPDRAEIPDGNALGRALAHVGEQLMLHGMRRLVVVGGQPTGQHMVRQGLDRRIDTRFAVADGERTEAQAQEDVVRSDAVVLWDVGLSDAARQLYRTSRALLIESGPGVEALATAVDVALEVDDGGA